MGDDVLNPDYPVVEGDFPLTAQWSVELPAPFNKRLEEEHLVLFRPGLRIFVGVWNNDDAQSQEARLAHVRDAASSDRYDEKTSTDGDVWLYGYRLKEADSDSPCDALYAFGLGTQGHVDLACFVDDESKLALAEQVWHSLDEHEA